MRTRNYGDNLYEPYEDAWPWVVAIDAYDFGDPAPLDELLSSEPVPEELRPVIASIASGKREPNLKAAAKLKIPASERMKIAGTISAALGLIDAIKYDAIDESVNDLSGVSMLADRPGKDREPVEILRELEATARNTIEWAAREAGVSVETIENLLRHLRRKMEQYPDV